MIELKAKTRKETGKKVSALRRAGFLPAVVYGEKIKSQPIAVSYKDFEKAYREAGESTLIQLDVDGQTHSVLIYDIANDPIKGRPLHADFYAVQMDKAIKTEVPLEFFGESPAVKNDGGILVKVIQEVEIEALPQDLPHSLKIDISSLAKFEDRIFIKDILLPKGVKILADPEEVVALVEPPRSEEELAELSKVEEAVAPAEVKTEREVKEAEKAEKAAAEEVIETKGEK